MKRISKFHLTLSTFFLAAPLLQTHAILPPEEVVELLKNARPDSQADLSSILEALQSKNSTVRGAAAFSLGERGERSPAVIEGLSKTLDDPNGTVRRCGASALLKLGEREVFHRRLKESPSAHIRREALAAIFADPEELLDPKWNKVVDELLADLERQTNPPPVKLQGSPLEDGAFDLADFSGDWEIRLTDGAEGQVVYDSSEGRTKAGALKLQKTNDIGELQLVSRRPLTVKPGMMPVVRLYFRADDATLFSTFQLYLVDDSGKRHIADSGSASITAESQTIIRNSPPGQWIKRVAEAPRRKVEQQYRVMLVLKGNPVTVKVDDVSAPATLVAYEGPAGSESMPPKLSEGEQQEPNPLEAKPAEARVVGMAGRSPQFQIDGKPVPPIFYYPFRSNMGEYAGMEQAGKVPVMVASVQLNDAQDGRYEPTLPVWNGGVEFDLTRPLRWIDHAARSAPKSHLVIHFNVNWPSDWGARHPEEIWRNAQGQRAYGNALQFGGFADELPDPQTQRWWPSPASRVAIEEAGAGIREMVQELKKKPYFNRIIGCFISGGHDGQFFTAMWPDHSGPARKGFREWIAQRYGSDEALQKAWNRPEATLATVDIPDYPALDAKRRSSGMYFLDPSRERAYADHLEFQAEQGFRIRESLATIFHEEIGKPAIGMTWQLGGGIGQGAEQGFLRGKSLDLMICQPGYSLRLPGISGGMRAPFGSLSRHGKIGIKELDLRTWLRTGGGEVQSMRLSAAMNLEMFRSILRKETAEMMAEGHGYWLYDISPTSFRDPRMMEEMAQTVKAYRELVMENPKPFQPDVAFVRKDDASYWKADVMHAVPTGNRLEAYVVTGLKQAGIPYETLFLNDFLKAQKEKPYKLVVIYDAYRLDDNERTRLEEAVKRNGTVVIWNYAPGYLSDQGLSTKVLADLVGMNLKRFYAPEFQPVRYVSGDDPLLKGASGVIGLSELGMTIHGERAGTQKLTPQLPRFVINDQEATPLAIYSDGQPAAAVRRFKDWTSIYLGQGGLLDPELLHRAAREAGATVLTPPTVVTAYTGRFLSLHPTQNGSVPLTLPVPAKMIDFDTGELLGEGREFSIPMKAGETRWYRLEPLN